ncbi:D-Ala-D-Ala carboxypeptidase family metallohydrolase [Wukongibacter baidiensis]|uniref:YcbK family protein n=1 Tax=Wukongibacter baidiensis TaxID=1723361 RepID=UPI003D7FFEC8
MYKTLNNIKLSKNFHLREFICKEGKQEVLIADELVEKLQALRDNLKKPITIVSAYRSPSYNKKINGSSKSQHMYGRAVDIKVSGVSTEEVAEAAIKLGFKGIGIYDTFTHVDIRENLVNKVGRKYDYWDMRTGK